jgi:putative aminopeptidase FrvX
VRAPIFDDALLGRLSEASGVSGGEDAVRRLLIDEVRDHVDALEIDALGNLVARIAPAGPRSSRSNGSRRPRRGPHVLLCAHMDEVGLMVFAIEKDGRVRVRRVGGIDQRILVGQVFRVGANGIRGVLGALPPHLVARPEREKVIPIDEMSLDIGASSRDEAERHVAVGDYACFDTTYEKWGSTRKGKAFDDRVGCTVLASLVRQRPPVPVTAVWSVQEEVGLRGAGAAARRANADLAIVLEGTASGEAPGTSVGESAPRMGGGPALTVQDRTLMADARLVDLLERTGKERKIPTQWKRPGVGGTDAGRISLSGAGIPSAVVSVACRYIHAPAAYLDVRDPQRVTALVWHTLESLRKEWT